DAMRGEIKRLHQEISTTMIYVTHDQIEAMTLADRIVLLKDGRIEQAGAPLDLFERPATRFVAGFLGSPAMNFVPARLARRDGSLGLEIGDSLRLVLPPARPAAYAHQPERPPTPGLRPAPLARARARSGCRSSWISSNRPARGPTSPSASAARRSWPRSRRTMCTVPASRSTWPSTSTARC